MVGINARGQRRSNRSTVLRTLLYHGPLARTAIAQLTGLSGASISRIVDELLDDGLLRSEEDGDTGASAARGRPRTPLDLNTEGKFVLSMHVGVHLVLLGVHDLRGRLVASRTVQPEAELEPSVMMETLFAEAGRLGRETIPLDASILGVGVGVGGWLDRSGEVHEHPTLVKSLSIADVGASLGYGPVYVDSLMHGMALAESWFGRFAGSGSLAILHVGNFVGSAVVTDAVNGRDRAIIEGSLGHLRRPGSTRPCPCGRHGCFWAEISDDAVADRARSVVRGQVGPTAGATEAIQIIADLARQGNQRAHDILFERAEGIGDAAAVLLAVADVDRVLLTGASIASQADLMVPLVQARLDVVGPRTATVEHTSFGLNAVLTSAAALVLRRIFSPSEELMPGHREAEESVFSNSPGRNGRQAIDQSGDQTTRRSEHHPARGA